jgi:photosystem II stability/assembly factor-like uncharacterized protein
MLDRSKQMVIGLACFVGISFAALANSSGDEGVLNQVYRGIPHDALFDVCFDGDRGVAVGVAGSVLNSEDAGMTWAPEQPVTSYSLLGVSCRGKSTIVVGQSGHIQVQTNGGDWQTVSSGTDNRLLSASANSEGLAVIVGGFGAVLRSTDAGVTWQQLTIDWEAILNDFLEPHIYDVTVFEDGTILLVGEFELVMVSTDGGDTWQVNNKADSELAGVHFRDRQNGYAVGQNGKVLKTTDGGQSWQNIEVPTRENLLDIWSSTDGEVITTGIRSLARSRDDGQTWEAITEDDVSIKWYQAVKGTSVGDGSSNNVVMVGHSGRIVQIK